MSDILKNGLKAVLNGNGNNQNSYKIDIKQAVCLLACLRSSWP